MTVITSFVAQAYSNRRQDLNLLWMRFELQSQLHVDGHYRLAPALEHHPPQHLFCFELYLRLSLETLDMILRRGTAASKDLPLDPVVKVATMKLAFEHHKNRRVESAAKVLRIYVQATEVRDHVDYDACNLLAECMVLTEQWDALYDFLMKLQNQRCARARSPV